MKVSPNKMRPVVAKRRMKKYLEVLAKTGNKTRAREDARLSHRKLDRLKEEYPEFEQAEQKALMDYVAILETEADRRAVEGVAEPVYYEGEIVGTKQKFSDPLLMFRLKGLYPDRYKDRVENSGQASGATINLYLPENGRK